MKKLIFKSTLYVLLILVGLEVLVRVFHLAKDSPTRYIDEYEVEKWKPNQHGYSVTGNRRQNFSEFRINNLGYNSYREFTPSEDKIEIALVGDSFIEGFHQDYTNSIGYKIEKNLNAGVEVYEYGYAGYDFADQMHLIHAYKSQFNLIDYVFISLKFDDDLTRGEYFVSQDRMQLETPLFKTIKKVKLLVYAQNIGLFDPIKNVISKITSKNNSDSLIDKQEENNSEQIRTTNLKYQENFKNLIETYGFDKAKYVLFFDGNITPVEFKKFLESNHIMFVDYSMALEKSVEPTTLIYDQHWNDNGRNIIAKELTNYYKLNLSKK